MGARRLRAGLCGCGGISDLTMGAAERSPDFEVVALQDPRPEALAAVGERYGVRRRHERLEELLEHEELDLLVVNSPNHLHREQTLAGLRAGLPVLVQKPIAPTLADARAMALAAREAGLPLGVTMFEHSKPLHHELKAMLERGWLGEPTLVQALSAHDFYLRKPPPPNDWRRDPARVGGGAFIQLALHQLDLARWLLAREVTLVCCLGTGATHTVFEDESDVAAVLFEDGVAGHFAAGYAASHQHFALAGTRGSVAITAEHCLVRGEAAWEGEVLRYGGGGREAVFQLAELEAATRVLGGRLEVHGRFARFVRDRSEDFPCTAEFAVRDLEVVDAAYRSRAEGRAILLRPTV